MLALVRQPSLHEYYACMVVRDQVYITCCCEFLVRSAFLSLVWHMHGVCLLHGHVAHSSHYG